MLFVELLKQVDITDVVNYISLDSSESKYASLYRDFYNKLLTREVISTGKVSLLVVMLKDYLGGTEYPTVYGYSAEDDTCYAIQFMDWSEWLGSEVVEKSLNTFGAVAFVGECFKEMTFFGFEEESMVSEKEELDRRVEEVEKGTVEMISADEFFSRLSEETGEAYNPEDYSLSEEEKKSLKENVAYNENMIKSMVK